MFITGIGSREATSNEDCMKYAELSKLCVEKDIILRSGNANGADKGFQSSYIDAGGDVAKVHAYMPRKNFNLPIVGTGLYLTDDQVAWAASELERLEIIEDFMELDRYTQQFFTRNYYQVFGIENQLSTMVLYNSPESSNGVVKGGTRIAVYLARHYDVDCFNIRFDDEFREAKRILGNL